jgi:hypothetical protein
MTSTETFEQLISDFDKTITALLFARTANRIRNERDLAGYIYNDDKNLREFWIAISQYSVVSNLSSLMFIINQKEEILPSSLKSKQDIIDYFVTFKNNKDKVIAVFDTMIGKPNIIFIGYEKPIAMEQYLQIIVDDINAEAQNLEFHYKELKE